MLEGNIKIWPTLVLAHVNSYLPLTHAFPKMHINCFDVNDPEIVLNAEFNLNYHSDVSLTFNKIEGYLRERCYP